jgi:hypothetical protein
VADLRKLGKRGGYRLGGLRSGPRAGGNAALRRAGRSRFASRRPVFGSSRSSAGLGWWAAVSVAGAAVIAETAEAGLWFMPFVAGLACGLAGGLVGPRAGWRARRALAAVLVMAVAGWGAPLVWHAAAGEPVGATARVIAALGGLPPNAVSGVVFVLLVACVQAAVGLWLGRAVTPRARPR